MATKTIFLTTTGTEQTWTIPSDFVSLIAVEAIGSGSSSTVKSGGGAGSYASSNSISGLVAGQTVYYRIQVNTLGGLAYFSKTTGNPTSTSNGVRAVSGTSSERNGGTAAASLGTVTYSGGSGGSSGVYTQGGGGGGAAGQGGAGANGGNAGSNNGYGGAGGGASSGGSVGLTSPSLTAGGAGGNSFSGYGGGAGATVSSNAESGSFGGGGGGGCGQSTTLASTRRGGNGGMSGTWTDYLGNTVGPGGGGGGGGSANLTSDGVLPGNAGGYGGGGGGSYVNTTSLKGLGTQGIIVFTYNAPDTVTITTQPTDQTVKEPATATFSIVASASGGTLTYKWQRSNPGTGGAAWADISGATSSSYTTPATSFAADDGAYYRCTLYIDGVYKATSSVVRLYVTPSATGNFFMVF